MSCNNSVDNNATIQTAAQDLNFIDTIVADGCSELYTLDNVSLKEKKYIFSHDKFETANIKIGTENIMLKTDTFYSVSENLWVKIFKGNGYTVEIRITETKQTGDEVYYEKGTLEINHNGQPKYKVDIHGESGC